MNNQLEKIQLKHTIIGEESWNRFFTENTYLPQSLKFPLAATFTFMYNYSYKRQGVYADAERKVENLIRVYNESQQNSRNGVKVAIVTGANTGIGYETARMLVRAGFHVIIACRSETKALEAIKRIEQDCAPVVDGYKGKAQFLQLDLTSLQSVRNFATSFLKLNLPLHYLINNAGIMWLPKFELTKDNHEMQFQVNHLAHFLLVNLLLPKLKETKGVSKIINLSSSGHYGAGLDLTDFATMDDSAKYNPYVQYFKTKAANVMFTYKLHRTLKEDNCYGGVNGVVAYACHPGAVNTELARYSVSPDSFFHTIKNLTFKTPLQGALSTLRLIFLNEQQLESDAKRAKCSQANKFTNEAPNHHLYYSDELPIAPLISTLDIKSQDNLWELSKLMVA